MGELLVGGSDGRKVKLSKIIDTAIPYLLLGKIEYSCQCIEEACLRLMVKTNPVWWFLRECGVDTNSRYQFIEFHEGTERQEARYMWLLMLKEAFGDMEFEGISSKSSTNYGI